MQRDAPGPSGAGFDRGMDRGVMQVRVRTARPEGFAPLLQVGVFAAAVLPDSLTGLLCGQLGLDPDYLEREVQTLFLDSRPVDDPAAALVRDGAVVGLGAAMPGLVGALLRRNSPLRGFRRDITDPGGAGADGGARGGAGGKDAPRPGRVRLKVFNLVAVSAGPGLLARGVVVPAGRLAARLRDLAAGTKGMQGMQGMQGMDGTDGTGGAPDMTVAVFRDGRPAGASALADLAAADPGAEVGLTVERA